MCNEKMAAPMPLCHSANSGVTVIATLNKQYFNSALTRHTVQSWLCCVLSSCVQKLAGKSHYTVTVQVTMSSHVEVTLSDTVTVSGALTNTHSPSLHEVMQWSVSH